ncbi:MAG: cytochrome c biosis protein CcmG, thiol:disulfide interchange protein DsbE [Pyrinomonadaceae bacterium]|jgi:cytochrome c biogenesis protein CcmG/thiol:disulfide interchange protein DsbE|nr:cytochrome c biosis protein CcmG, thiol:disulfide interchange protein DsbE [Pyrinomonadaceae bacterium]
MTRFAIPLVLFILLVAFLAIGLRHDPHEVPSPLIDKPAPAFQLAQLRDPSQTFSAADMRGKVWLLNVWASWCVTCRDEHPLLLQYARSGALPIYGLNYKDKREDALSWLGELGDPYVLSVSDNDGRVGIDYGVYGAPETYLIDRDGIIRFKQIGPVTPDIWQKTILPLAQKLNE